MQRKFLLLLGIRFGREKKRPRTPVESVLLSALADSELCVLPLSGLTLLSAGDNIGRGRREGRLCNF